MNHHIGRQLVIFVSFSLVIGLATWMTPIAFDDAFNLQVARSLAEKFSYQSQYIPTQVYHGRITTNGPFQYGMAALIKLFGLDAGRSVALGLIGGLTALTIYRFSIQSFMLYCLLLLLWPLFALSHVWFCGEILASAMILAGIQYWEQWRYRLQTSYGSPQPLDEKKIWNDHALWISGLAFGLAISTKLISIVYIIAVIFCLSIDTKKQITTNIKNATTYIAPALAIAIMFFITQFSLSVMHSNGDIFSTTTVIKSFIQSHFWQAGILQSKFELRETYIQQYEIPIAISIACSLFILIKNNTASILLALFVAMLIFVFHFNQRRMLPLTITIMMLSIRNAALPGMGPSEPKTIFTRPLLLYVLILLFGYALTTPPIYLANRLEHFSLAAPPTNQAYVSQGQWDYAPELIPILQKLKGPIFTSGWWQFPEISLRAGLAFHDRFAGDNQALLTAPGATLLFSNKNSEDSSSQETLCGKVIFQDRDLVLCEYRPIASNLP